MFVPRSLGKNGSSFLKMTIEVKYEDREEYVRLYTEWILHDSVKDQIHAFKRGFDKSAQLTVKERHEMLAAKL